MNPRIKVAQDKDGSFKRFIQVTEEEIEMLLGLQQSTAWKVLQSLLYAQRDEIMLSLLMDKPDKEEYSRKIGKADGLHSAASHLDLVALTHKQKAERVAEESKNQPQP
jgi:hypothetical protein